MVKLGSNYLKTEECKTGDTVRFTDEGSWVETTYKHPDGNPKHNFVISIDYKGEEKSMRLNKTNRDVLVNAYGNETKDWVGKIGVINIETVLVAGERKKTILLSLPKTPNNEESVEEVWNQ